MSCIPEPRRTGWASNLAVLVVTLLLIALIDRGLLAILGRPIWEWDPILHYRHRPGASAEWEDVAQVRMLRERASGSWTSQGRLLPGHEYRVPQAAAARMVREGSAELVPRSPYDLTIEINGFGHHDDEFPTAKPAGELRGLAIGNSVVMGHRVTAGEAFPNRLEVELAEHGLGYASYQVINTGVQGYSTAQYLETLRRSMRFGPDFIVVGFCLNDITDPYRADVSLGGSGLDFHGIIQAPNRWSAYLMNETGFGRLSLKLRSRVTGRERLERQEAFSVRRMVEGMTREPSYAEAWNRALADLDEIYGIGDSHGVPVVLVVFPFVFQLEEPALREPQRVLRQHAEERGVTVVDVIQTLEPLIGDGPGVTDVFLDRVHLTARGHGIVAATLADHLLEGGLISAMGEEDRRPFPGAVAER